jgi:hypothetical protein
MIQPPSLPLAPIEYDRQFQDDLNRILRLFFVSLTARAGGEFATINIDINTLPTQTALANLRSGDVYRDTSAGNALKVKP